MKPLSDKVMLSDWIPYGTPVKMKPPKLTMKKCFSFVLFWRR